MSVTLAEAAAWVIVVALNAYVLFGGADFGGGVWDLLATGPRKREQRELISRAIGPIWEANHVWLIVVVVMLFVCFPPAFAVLGTVLHIPLSLMLVGIVLRGSAFVFRAYSYGPRSEQRRWGQVFAVSSLITPIVLGMCVGAIVSGGVGAAMSAVGVAPAAALPEPNAVSPIASTAGFFGIYVRPWVTPFTIAVGLMTLALLSFLAATYLTVEARGNPELQDDFRGRAIAAAIASMAIAAIALALGVAGGGVMTRLIGEGWSLLVRAGSAIAAVASVYALAQRRYQFARIGAAAWVTLTLWGWILAQFPFVIPPALTIDDAAAPSRTLIETMAVLVGGGLVLVPSLWYLLRVFKGRQASPSREQ
jgi:cytochrome d ubiquinol oxidase subunit II